MADTTKPVAGDPPAPVAIFKQRGAKAKANIRKRAATPPPANSDSDDDDYTSSEDEAGQRVKRRKKNNGTITASSRDTKPNSTNTQPSGGHTIFDANRSVPMTNSNDATKQSNWYDESTTENDSSLLGKTRPLPNGKDPTIAAADGTYKGLANATKYISKNPDAPSRTVGPIKAATNIRTITVTDFAPDVCKDYKQTGFCGFGDNCKFLHAREVYQQGWQLDKEWEKVNRGKKTTSSGTVFASADRSSKSGGGAAGEEGEDAAEAALLEKIPFACIICKGPYKEPIITRCGHYFCLPCALQRYKKDPSCAACGAGTSGVFNTAKTLNKLLEKKKAREDRLKAEEGEED